jgi:hypothetical protein
MRKRDGIGGVAVLLIAVIILILAALVYGVMVATKYLPRH